MAFLEIHNVKISGIAACCPQKIEENERIYSKWGDCENFLNTTGITSRRISDEKTCSSDLCVSAAEKLIEELGWQKDSIEAVVFVSQTPDYVIPATSPIIQDRMGLSQSCYTLDISLGCSGWVYALSVLSSLMQNGFIKRGLLMAGDTLTKICSKEDKSTYPLFGDAGTVTALEYVDGSESMAFVFNSDGEGKNAIMMKNGGQRFPVTLDSLRVEHYGDGIARGGIHIGMDGMSVFSFAISQVPRSVNVLMDKIGKDKDEIDCFCFHQANMFLNEKIRKKMHLEEKKVPYCLSEYGNTSCASIPLTLVTERRTNLISQRMRLICCGFGVGLSWGSVYFETNKIVCPSLVEI